MAEGGMHSLKQALSALTAGVTPLEVERVALADTGGRVLADTLVAHHDIPPFDNSAMDGYALRAADAGRILSVSQSVRAGQAPVPLEAGTCARIFTGAPLPEGADSVVMQERVEPGAGGVFVPTPLERGNNVRARGREIVTGATLIETGTRLDSAALGLLASQGYTHVPVYRRPRVALLSTGDELRMPGEPLAPGQIYNSNRFMLGDLLPRFGAELVLVEHVADTLKATLEALGRAAAGADVVVTSGGVSVGEADHVRHALERLGRLDLWRLAIRPGKPLALGRIGQARFVGLAGNPVSSFVGAWLFLRPLLGALQGAPHMQTLESLTARADFETATTGRTHYMRVTLSHGEGEYRAHAFPDQDSSILRSCVGADALAVVAPHTAVAPGDRITCLRLLP